MTPLASIFSVHVGDIGPLELRRYSMDEIWKGFSMAKKSADVVQLRKGSPTAKQQSELLVTAQLTGALFRRAIMAPVEGHTIFIDFGTEAEAKEFQRLLYALKAKRK